MPNYQNGKIYKLWTLEGNDIYIGSTTLSLSQRRADHVKKFKNGKGCSSSKILFEKYNDIRIELLEECPCENKEQLTKKEGEYIRNNICVNKEIAGRTDKEYREDNKEKIKERHKEYYKENNQMWRENREKNKDKINERRREKRALNKLLNQ